jgi:hypothetical protein
LKGTASRIGRSRLETMIRGTLSNQREPGSEQQTH